MFAKYGTALAMLILSAAPGRADVVAFQGLFGCGAAQTANALTTCANRDFSAAERDLKDAYAAALLRMNWLDQNDTAKEHGAAEALQAAEKAWVAYRDLGCSAESLAAPSADMRATAVLACKARLTANRSEELWMLSGGP